MKGHFSAINIRRALGLYGQTRQPHTAHVLRIGHGQIKQKVTIFATCEKDTALIAGMRHRPDTEWPSEHVEAAFTVVAQSEAQRQLRTVRPERQSDPSSEL